jgi:hypothetical protein
MKQHEEKLNRNAGLLLARVQVELDEGAQGEVRQLIREVAHRAGVSPQVEQRARDAWEAELAKPDEAKWTARRMALLALSQVAGKLLVAREAA